MHRRSKLFAYPACYYHRASSSVSTDRRNCASLAIVRTLAVRQLQACFVPSVISHDLHCCAFTKSAISARDCLSASNISKKTEILGGDESGEIRSHAAIISPTHLRKFSAMSSKVGAQNASDDQILTSSVFGRLLKPSKQDVHQEEQFDVTADFIWNPKQMLADLIVGSKKVALKLWNPRQCQKGAQSYQNHLNYYMQRQQNQNQKNSKPLSVQETNILLSPKTAVLAARCLLKSKVSTLILRQHIRDLERLIGSIRPSIPMTDNLSFILLEANGKVGNIGRTLSLLELRTARQYPPRQYEFNHAIQAIISAGVELRICRSPYLPEAEHSQIDNPTRWLDSILVNMNRRDVRLDIETANLMLSTYSSTGRTGRAMHFFHKVKQTWAPSDDAADDSDTVTDEGNEPTEGEKSVMPNKKTKPRILFCHPPPTSKVPSQSGMFVGVQSHSITGAGREKFLKETRRDWSLPLTAAFAFANSLTHGACGHDPIQLDMRSWNALIKACCYRGALWRAVHILREKIPQAGLEPNVYSYNTILSGLARAGDTASLRDFLTEITNKNIPLNKYTVQAITLGHLNVGDVGGATSIVQDVFNQHGVLPPYTTHLEIIELALVNNLMYEAKRHVYFLQQIWKYTPPEWMSEEKKEVIRRRQRNSKLGREGLIKLFEYHGAKLTEADFF